MPKARRRLSDLVQEETQKVREQNLQKEEVTKSDSLPETLNEVKERVAEQQTSNITDLQTLNISESVPSIQVAVEDKGKGVQRITETQNSEDTDLQTSEFTTSEGSLEEVTEQRTSNITDLQSTELPKYLKLERKEARLRQDQIDGLTDLTRKLNRIKRGKGGERLTDNTLIRVAVDLLLSKASELKGTTEEELRSSLDL